jgi:hypothetical protein
MGVANGPARAGHTSIAALGALLLILLLNLSLGVGASERTPEVPEPASTPSLRLVVDPDSWWMAAGNVTPFTATWGGPTPGCNLTPYWFRWSVPGGSAEGTIAPTAGANVNFSATSAATGRTTLVVRSAAVLTCGGQNTPAFAMAEANVTVVAPVVVQNLSVDPNPVTAGGVASLRGNVTGGEPPYTLHIVWGDGTTTAAGLSSPGSFSISHSFPSGDFSPTLEVTDSSGLLARGTVAETLAASDSLVAGIGAQTYITDVGLPVRFNATVLPAPTGDDIGWSCGVQSRTADPRSFASPGTGSTEFSCSFSNPGTGFVFFEALPPAPLAPATATLDETVVPVPTLGAETSNLSAEVGQPTLATFNVTGGVPPFRLDWTEVGSSVAGELPIATDGTVLLPIIPREAGSLELVARLVDGEGFATSNVTARLRVDPALNDSTVADRTPTPASTTLALTTTVVAGAPPYSWVVVPAFDPLNETDPAGSLGGVGWFGWAGSYRSEGWTTVTVTVVDAAGGIVAETRVLEAVPPLIGTVSVAPDGPPAPGTFALGFSFAGGIPPFEVSVSANDGESWNRTVASEGNSSWVFAAAGPGTLKLRVDALDGTGVGLEWNVTVEITPGPTPASYVPPAPTPLVGDVAVVLLLVGCLAVGLYLRRRRSRPAPAVPPDPVTVLRRIIEPADGADRTTVELLAEEAGIPLAVVRSTIDRLVREGTILSEGGIDEGEVVSWSATSPP